MQDIKSVLPKLLIVVVVVVIFLMLNNNGDMERFENKIETEKANYIKTMSRMKNTTTNNIEAFTNSSGGKKSIEMFYADVNGNLVEADENIEITNTVNKPKPIREKFTVVLDQSSDLPQYQNLFKTPDFIKMPNYVNDVYGSKLNIEGSRITNKLNDIQIAKELSTSLNKTEDEYNALSLLNHEIEKQIFMMNGNVSNTNDKIINNLDKMKLTDMADDYYFLKNLAVKKN